MFLNKMIERNSKLIETSFQLHQMGKILPDSYVVDMDTLLENAKLILDEGRKYHIDQYFMLKQLGRNPIIAQELMKLGFKGAVVVDFKEALVMMKHHIPICNVGHLVQMPKQQVQKLVDYGCDYFTVFSMEKVREIDQAARRANRVQKLLLKVVGSDDMIYSGQTAGFRLEELENIAEQIKQFDHVSIEGVTSFPCFLYSENEKKITPTNNLNTLLKAKEILKHKGIEIKNVNAPSATSVFTIKEMRKYPVNSCEPGHGLTGTTPMHAKQDCGEVPCVVYVSEVSHNFDGHAYCYGGGHYRRSHVANALVGVNLHDAKKVNIIPPTDESIDYYFEIPETCRISDTVIMAFRYQVFVTRSQVVLVSGISANAPQIMGIYNSLGDECHE